MFPSPRALALALTLGLASAAPAYAVQTDTPQIKLSKNASKPIVELQKAIEAGDFASVPAKVAAASAVATTPDDKYAIAQLQLRAAVAQKNDAATMAALEAMLATGRAPATSMGNLRLNLGKLKFAAKDYAGASAALEPVVAAEPNNADALVLLAETKNAQGQGAAAVPLLQKAIAIQTAAGQPAPKDWTKRAVALAYNNKLPMAGDLALAWVKSDPSPTNWRDAIKIYAESNKVAEADQIDLYRLQRAAGALKGEADYYRYANGASTKGLAGEAKAVLDEGFASNAIKRNAPAFAGIYPAVSAKIAADKASLPAAEKSALAGAAARPAMVTGDAYLGYGDYAKAAALYRAALTKSGVDKDLANLRLGIALARSGDKAGATGAFNAVGGARAPIAKLWLVWVGAQA
jgi:hypothetical protein